MAAGTLRPIVGGLKFFYSVTCPREWKSIHSVRVPKTRTLPIILSREQVRRLIDSTYVFRVAVTENRITKCDWHPDIDQAKVTLMVKRSGTEKYRPMPLSVTEFIRRYLQHVLPSGFQKVRHFGFLNGNCAIPFLLILWRVAIANERVMELCRTDVIVAPWVPSLKCQACGGVLICQEILLPNGMRFDVRPPPEIRARGSPVQEGLT